MTLKNGFCSVSKETPIVFWASSAAGEGDAAAESEEVLEAEGRADELEGSRAQPTSADTSTNQTKSLL